jgi:protein TonB
MTGHRVAIACTATILAAGVFFPPTPAKVIPGTEPDIPELDRLQNVDRRVSVEFENVPAVKMLEVIAAAGEFRVYSDGSEDCCYVTVSLANVPVRRALEILAGQTGLRYEVVSADSLRVMLPSPLLPTDDMTMPKIVTKVDPVYPNDARDARVDGKVVLQAVIRENGTVGEVQVLTAIPNWPSLDRSAVEAVQQWKYRPAVKDGHPVSVYFTVMIQFRLAEADQNEVGSQE